MTSLTRASLPARELHNLEEEYRQGVQEHRLEEEEGEEGESTAPHSHLQIDVEDAPGGTSDDEADGDSPLGSPTDTVPMSMDFPINSAPAGQSSVNAPRSQEDNKKFWGGKMVDSVQAVEGNISLFSDECLSIHGLYDAFYSRNGWGRTTVYLFSWLFFGGFFLFLTLPLAADYNQRRVTTEVDFQEGTSEGLPLPIVTVCPHGSGVRCDCLLWRKLHCRYAVDVPNTDWQSRFSSQGCIHEFVYDPITGEPFWADPQCDDFGDGTKVLIDPCQPSPVEMKELPFLVNVTTDDMFDTVVKRETVADGPYLTYEELLVYGSRRVATYVNFYRGGNSIRKETMQRVPPGWIQKLYMEPSRFQICIQVRPPFAEKQTIPGPLNGISIIIDHMTDDLHPLQDADSATPAVDLHINFIDQDRYDEPFLYVERHKFFPVGAGAVTQIEYSVSERIRKQGWGQSESQTCRHDVIPRSSCVEKTLLDRGFSSCNCSEVRFLQQYMTDATLSHVAGCSASPGTEQNECIATSPLKDEVTIEECPTQCHALVGEVQTSFVVRLSDKQVEYAKNLKAFEWAHDVPFVVDPSILRNETAIIRIGVNTLFKTKFIEDSKVSFGALLGQIGGNAGLWCGLSFVLMIESLEFVIVALLYGSGFYSGGRKKALAHHARSIFQRRRRQKTSRS